jgi:membrane-bound lytic murein transglycosylase A
MAASAAAAPAPVGASAEPLSFSVLEGWDHDDHAAAFAVFRGHCAALVAQRPELRAGTPPPEALLEVCRRALALPAEATRNRAKSFFEENFQPFRIRPDQGQGFLTGYFEPETTGSLVRTPEFSAPVYGRPDDLVNLARGENPPGLDPLLAAARRIGDKLAPYADRPAIYAGALAGKGLEQLFLRDEPEVFIIQVQGSARVKLAGGGQARLTYSGRTGHPYTSIGRILINEGRIRQEDMSLGRLMAWLRDNPGDARRVMESNRSYVFFRRIDDFDPALGPTGGAGLPLTAERSLAVDRMIWAYGLPVWISASLDTLDPETGRLNRLVVAQDTGSAIVGPARADYYWGTGEEAGRRAGLTRHALGFTVLWPKAP